MNFTQGFTMIVKIIFAFCIFQVAFGQDEDLEQQLQHLITQSNIEALNYTALLIGRSKNFDVSLSTEYLNLQNEALNLQSELEFIATQLNSGTVDPDSCLSPALGEVNQIFEDRRNQIISFRQEEYDDIHGIFNRINEINVQEIDLILDTVVQVRECKNLGTTEQVNTCNAQLFSAFNALHDEILNTLFELHEIGQATLDVNEEKFQILANGNRQFVYENRQLISDQLTKCIQNL